MDAKTQNYIIIGAAIAGGLLLWNTYKKTEKVVFDVAETAGWRVGSVC